HEPLHVFAGALGTTRNVTLANAGAHLHPKLRTSQITTVLTGAHKHTRTVIPAQAGTHLRAIRVATHLLRSPSFKFGLSVGPVTVTIPGKPNVVEGNWNERSPSCRCIYDSD